MFNTYVELLIKYYKMTNQIWLDGALQDEMAKCQFDTQRHFLFPDFFSFSETL